MMYGIWHKVGAPFKHYHCDSVSWAVGVSIENCGFVALLKRSWYHSAFTEWSRQRPTNSDTGGGGVWWWWWWCMVVVYGDGIWWWCMVVHGGGVWW